MLHLKSASLSDIPLIHALAAKTWANTYGEILSPEQLEWMFHRMYSHDSLRRQITEGQQFFIAYRNETPYGYISIEREGSHLFHFQKIYVIPEGQGKGIGAALVEKGIAYVRSIQPEPCRIELNVNRANKALHFYRKMGFEIDREGDFPIGNGYFMNDYIMKLEL
ncbi:MAG: GNAT family N-acetyltransferase [Bacteroidales bacterium]